MTTHKWKDIKRRKKNRSADDAWVRRELLKMTLRELRKEVGDATQKDLADKIEMTQGELSKLESRQDHLLSTLRTYVEALGGRLEVVAVFRPKGRGERRITLEGV